MTYDPYSRPPKPGMSTGAKVALFGCLPATVLGALLFGGCAVIGAATLNEVDKSVKADKAEDERAAKEDVKITKCEVTESVIGLELNTTVKVTNNGAKRADYVIEGEFLGDDGNQVSELLATVTNLAPGKSTTQDFGGILAASDQLKTAGKGSCSVLDVSRSELTAAN